MRRASLLLLLVLVASGCEASGKGAPFDGLAHRADDLFTTTLLPRFTATSPTKTVSFSGSTDASAPGSHHRGARAGGAGGSARASTPSGTGCSERTAPCSRANTWPVSMRVPHVLRSRIAIPG